MRPTSMLVGPHRTTALLDAAQRRDFVSVLNMGGLRNVRAPEGVSSAQTRKVPARASTITVR